MSSERRADSDPDSSGHHGQDPDPGGSISGVG